MTNKGILSYKFRKNTYYLLYLFLEFTIIAIIMQFPNEDWICIVNPKAGSGKTLSEWKKAEEELTENGIIFQMRLTNFKYHATKIAYDAAFRGYRHFLAVGGDGSAHEVYNGILEFCEETGIDPLEFYLGVIPIGSGNDWIKSTKIPKDVSFSVGLISAGSFDVQDVVKVETSEGVSYMLNVGGTGFDSHVCQRVNRQKERGKRKPRIYASALLHTIRRLSPFKARIETEDGVVFSGEIYSLALGNGPYSGGGMRQVPKAVLNDGLLDYMVVPKIPICKLLKEAPRLFKGNVDESDAVVSGQCRTITVTGDRNDLVEVDGEIKGNLPLRVSMTGKKINILVGESL